ncbi:MAG: MarC family protein [Sphingomonadaceae bacterium]|nr:MarC family protein [Sphingomonadaceae bacterium]
MVELFISAFVTFFVVIDPPGCAPIFASLTGTAPAPHRRAMAVRSTLVAALILYLFAIFGEAFLGALGISLDAFRVAGGVMLFLIALEMVFEKRTERRTHRAEDVKADPEHEDISIFPMAIPMIAGPGSIASVMLLTSKSVGMAQTLVVLGALALVLLVNLAALLAAGPLMKAVGHRVEAMITRILGVVLAALAAQFIIDGVKASFQL